jgi:pimeloyl-ACP methyl ester carboxylesterase
VGFWHRLATHAGAALDGAVVRILSEAVSRSGPRRPPRRAAELLGRLAELYGAEPDALFRPPPPAEVTAEHVAALPGGGSVVDLRFPSSYEPLLASYRDEHVRHEANLTAHARWYRGPGERPALVCLHGLGGGPFFLEERVFVARYWYRLGLDVVLFQLPFHGLRRPRGRRVGFPSPHVVRTNETFGQIVHELRALMAWLRARDVPQIGFLGMSLGGYVTALLASLEADLAFAVPMIPAVSMSSLMWRHGAATASRRRAEEVGVTQDLLDDVFRPHAPLARAPRVPHERRFLIAGRGDRITPPDQAEALWEHWGRPTIHWFPGGHLAQVGRGDAFRALRRCFHHLGITR